MNDSESDPVALNTDFGCLLAEARKAKNFTVEQVSDQLKIPVQMITALENNDIEVLPASTYTQGYIRTYAKFLLIDEQSVLDIYHNAVPRTEASTLKPRSNLPDEASSQSPLIKMITILLLLAGVAAVLFGGYNYYQQKADVIEDQIESRAPNFTGNSLDSPGTQRLQIKQNARLSEDDELILEPSEVTESVPDETEVATMDAAESTVTAAQEASEETSQPPVEEPAADVEPDTLEIIADQGAWMEVRDATDARLFYNMVPRGSSKTLKGEAPFRISLGNAETTRIIVNGLEVDLSSLIRANNTASFSVSTQGRNLIFH